MVEHGGKWKMSHYFAYNFFSPTLVSPVIEESQLVKCTAQNLPPPLVEILQRILFDDLNMPIYSLDLI